MDQDDKNRKSIVHSSLVTETEKINNIGQESDGGEEK